MFTRCALSLYNIILLRQKNIGGKAMETEFSVNISKLRKERGLNQRKAASELKISQALLSHYENGIREPGLDFVIRVCDYYNVSADFVLGRTTMRETVLVKSDQGSETPESAALDRAKHESVLLAAAIFRVLAVCGDEIAIPALNYVMTAEYRLLRSLFTGSEQELLLSEKRKAETLSDIDMKLISLKLIEELGKQDMKLSSDIIRKNVSKASYKSYETALSRIDERINAVYNTPKTEKK
jgi:Predicted transcriptional regulator